MGARRCRPPLEAVCTLLLLAACAPESDRPALSSQVAGGAIDGALLVGTWRCRDLNPYPGQPGQVITTRYAADGSYVSESEIAARGPLGPIAVVQSGRWSVAGDRLLTQEVTTRARALDGNTETDALARASAELIDLMAQGEPAAAELLRLDARRLTLRPAGVTDPPVIGCVRQADPPPLAIDGSRS